MFPLADVRGRVRGFGARQMPGGRPPKYLNSQDGPLFRKSEIVYGLDQARAEVARQSAAIVVEGYTDVLLLNQVGIENVVASMGTALTDQQVQPAAPVVQHGVPRLRRRRRRRGGVDPGDGAGAGGGAYRACGDAAGRARPGRRGAGRPRRDAGRSRRRRDLPDLPGAARARRRRQPRRALPARARSAGRRAGITGTRRTRCGSSATGWH